MSESVAKNYLENAIATFRDYKALAERAIRQLRDEDLLASLDPEDNSIGVLMRHISGNMLSRWTDFLTTDGEKPWRRRDHEFVLPDPLGKDDLMAEWDKGWECLFDALEGLTPPDLERTVMIRGRAHSVIEAVNRQLTHYAYHVGQIVFLAKHFRGEMWQSLSIPRNRSHEFNSYMSETPAAPRESGSGRFQAAWEFGRNATNTKEE